MNLILKMNLCPGDVLMLTAAVRDLAACPQMARSGIVVRTPAMDLWKFNPHVLRTPYRPDRHDRIIECNYPLIHSSNTHPWHFIHGYRMDLERQLGFPVPAGPARCDIHLSDDEKIRPGFFPPRTGKKVWLLNAGHKDDFTCKMWSAARYAEVVAATSDRILWIQIGETSPGHRHSRIPGALDMRGKTSLRALCSLMYHADGCLTGVSFPMHLATMPCHPESEYKIRPCVVVAGGREPSTWEAYNGHRFLSTVNTIPCSRQGGCWKSRVTVLPLNDKFNSSLCLSPVTLSNGETIPRCMDMIRTEDVIRAVSLYL